MIKWIKAIGFLVPVLAAPSHATGNADQFTYQAPPAGFERAMSYPIRMDEPGKRSDLVSDVDGTVHTGLIYLGLDEICFALVMPPREEGVRRLIVDRDGDNDLKDEEPITLMDGLSAPLTIQTRNGVSRKYRFELKELESRSGTRRSVALCLAEYLVGTVAVDGERYKALILDTNHDGANSDRGDYVLLDSDRDGRFSEGPVLFRDDIQHEMLPLGCRILWFAGNLRVMSWDKDEHTLTFTDFIGSAGKLRADIAGQKSHGHLPVVLSLSKEDIECRSNPTELLDDGIRLPVGKYDKVSITIGPATEDSHDTDGKYTIEAIPDTPVEIRENEETVLSLDSRPEMVVLARQSDRSILVSPVAHLNKQFRIVKITVNGKPLSPEVSVFKQAPGAEDKLIVEGKMKYG